MKTRRTTTNKIRPSICTSTIATAVMVLSQVASFAPSASADTFITPFGTQAASGVLTGPDLVMNGGGLLLLGSAQPFLTTTITLNDGSVSIVASAALGSGVSPIVIDAPAINGVNFQATRGAGAGNLTVGGGITVARDFSLRGTGSTGDTAALTNVGNNTFSGVISTGTGAATRLLSTAGTGVISNTINLGLGQTGQLGGNGNWLVSGVIAGGSSAALQKVSGAGSVELTGTNTYGGITTMSAGFLRVSSQSNLGTSTANTAITLAGGTLEIRGDAPTFGTKGLANTASASVFVDHAVGSQVQNQTADFRTLALTANVTTTLNGRDGYGVTFNGMVGGSLANNNTINNNLNGLVTYTGNFWNQTNGTARTFTLGGNGDSEIDGNILASGAAHNITKTGTGTLTILATGTGSTFTGQTNVNAGTLAINSVIALNNASTGTGSQVNIGNGATAGVLAFVGSGAPADYNLTKTVNLAGTSGGATLTANQTGASAVVINDLVANGSGNKTLTLSGSNTADNLIAGAITNGGTGTTTLAKTGTGTWALGGTNTYGGTTTINDGTVKLIANAATSTIIPDTSNVIFNTNGGTLELVGQAATVNVETLGQLVPTAGAGTIKLTPGAGGNASMVFTATGTAATALGAVNNASSVNVVASGVGNTVTLTGVADGIVDPHITYNGGDFAIATTGVLSAPTYDVTTGFNTAGPVAFSSANHNLVNAAITTGAADTIKSLKISGSQTVTLGGLLTINTQGLTTGANTAGGIIQTGGSSTITGAGISTGTAGNLVIRVDGASDSLTLASSSPITATGGGLTKNGAGTLIILGTNAQAGQTTINEGTIQLAGTGRLSANNGALLIRRNGTLDLNGVNNANAIGSFNGDGKVINSALGGVNLTVGNNNQGGTFSGVIDQTAGVISLVKQGTAGQTWSGLNTYTGSTTINSTGVVSVNTLKNGGVASSIGQSTNAASNLVFGGASITGATGGINYTGTESTSTDRLFTLASQVAGGSGGGRIQNNSANQSSLVFSNPGAIVVTGTTAQTLTLGGTSTGDNVMGLQLVNGASPALNVRKEEAGLWILGNATNTYSGTTLIVNGQLQAAPGALGTGGLILGTGTSGTGVFQGSGSLTRTIGTGAGTVSWSSTALTGAMGFASASGTFDVNLGAGIWDSTPGFIKNNVALLLSSATALGEVNYTGGIDLNGVSRVIQVDDNTNAGTDLARISGVISGAAGIGIIKTGNGLLTLAGSNTYLGDTEVRAGVINVSSLGQSAGAGSSNVGADGTGAVKLGFNATAGTLDYIGAGETSSRAIQATGTSGATTTIRSNGTGALILSNVVNTATGTAGRTITVGGENTGPNEITNVLADNGGPLTITKTDGGVWIANAANTYSGNTNVNSGAFGIGADASGAADAPTSGPIGVGTLVMNNGSIMALNGDRTIINPVTLGAATSGYMGDNAITINSTVTSAGASLLNNFLPTGKALTLNGTVTNSVASTITFQGSGESVVNGLITQSGTANQNIALNATGNGTLRISGGAGPNTYNGSTTLTAGTLILDKLGAIPNTGTASIVNLNGGTLQATSDAIGVITNTTVVGGNPTISGSSTVDFQGEFRNSGGNRIVTNNISGIGKTLILSGTVNLSENNTGRTLTLGGTGNTSITGIVSNGGTGAGTLATIGSGTVTLSNTGNSYTGGTVINGGTLKLGASEVIPTPGTVTIRQEGAGSTSGVLDLAGFDESIVALTLGSTAATGSAGQTPMVINSGAPATLFLNGNVTYNAGNVAVPNGQATISATLGLGTANRTFIVGDSSAAPVDLLVSGAITQAGTAARSITKQGTGTMVISNTGNNYTGGTVVENGTLRLGAADVIPNAGTVTVRAQNVVGVSPGVLDINGFSDTIGALSMGNTATGTAGGAGNVSSVINSGDPSAVLTLGGTVTYNAGTTGFNNGTATISANLGLGNANRTFAIADSANTTTEMLVSGILSNGGTAARSITKTGTGVLELSGNNTFTGSTTIAGGTAGGTLRANGVGSLGLTSAVIVQTGATLELAGSGNRVNNAAPITLGAASTPVVATAATLATNGTSEALGVLTLSGPVGGASVIDLGAGASILAFANSSGASWLAGATLSLWNWTGTPVTGGGTDQVFFGTDTAGLTSGQLGAINFYSDAGTSLLGTAVFASSGNGEITVVPEPGTVGSLIGGFGLLLGLRRRKARRA